MAPRLSAGTKHTLCKNCFGARPYGLGVWITDELLRETFDRFVAVSLPRRRSGLNFRSVRRGSSIPGPLEARRRLARRSLISLSHTSQNNIAPAAVDNAFVLSQPSYGWFQSSAIPRTAWSPPLQIVAAPDASESFLDPILMSPPDPPHLRRPVAYPRFTPQQYGDMSLPKTQKLSINEYAQQLSSCTTLRDLQQLHTRLSDSSLETSFCSSLAFQHLLAVRSNNTLNEAGEPRVTLTHLVDFLLDHKLEHTRGSNLAKLISHVSETNAPDIHGTLLMALVKNGIKYDLFSAQALAALYPHLMNSGLGLSTDLNLIKDVTTRYIKRLASHNDNLPPTSADLENLVHLTSALADETDVALSVQFIFDRTLYGLQSGHVTFFQLPSILNKLQPLVLQSRHALQTKTVVSAIEDMLSLKAGRAFSMEVEAEILQGMLAITNSLHVLSSTMELTSDIILNQVHQPNFSLTRQGNADMDNNFTQAALNFLFFDKIRPSSSAPSRDMTSSQTPSLSCFFNTLPFDLAQSWFSQSSNFIINMVRQDRSSENLGILNAWLIAASKSNARYYIGSKAWATVLEKLSGFLHPRDLSGYFGSLGPDLICRIMLRYWLRRDLEARYIVKPRSSDVLPVRTLENGLGSKNYNSAASDAPALLDRGKSSGATIEPGNSGLQTKNYENPETTINIQEILQMDYAKSHKASMHSPIAETSIVPPSFQERYAQITVTSLEILYDCRKIEARLRGGSNAGFDACAHLLHAFMALGLPIHSPLLRLLKMGLSIDRPALVSRLVSLVADDLNMRPSKSMQGPVGRLVAKQSQSSPGYSLWLFRKIRNLPFGYYRAFLTGLIMSPNSRVHPDSILRIVLQHEPGCRSRESKLRLSRLRNGPLGQKRIDMIHEAALMFAGASRFRSWMAWQSVLKCLEFLENHNAPLDRRISKALVQSGLTRALMEPSAGRVPSDRLQVCHRVLRKLEGEEVADAVLRTVYRWDNLMKGTY